MEGIANFFGDPLVWPAVVYFLAYIFAWIIALGIAQFLKRRVSIERVAVFAWGIAFFVHILGGIALIIWLWDRANNRFAEAMFYFSFYIVIILVDVCLLFLLLTKNRKKNNPNAPTPKLSRKSPNPKKMS